jgi:hypothetical protein
MSNETLPAEWGTAPQPASLKEVEMEGRRKITVGSKVKIKHQHWLRALEDGVVVEYRPRARNSWLVQFEHRYPGGGIDGDKLYFAEGDFLEIEERGSTKADVQTMSLRSNEFVIAPNGHEAH